MKKKKQNNQSNLRRNLVMSLATGGVASAAVPKTWIKPIVNSTLLPAHATSSLVFTIGGLVDVAEGTDLQSAPMQVRHILDHVVEQAHASRSSMDAVGRLCAMVSGNSVADVTLTFENNVFTGGPGTVGAPIELTDAAQDHVFNVIISSPSENGGNYNLSNSMSTPVDAGSLSGACPTMGESVLDIGGC